MTIPRRFVEMQRRTHKPASHATRLLLLLITPMAPIMLTACSGGGATPRDFNELIPRIMGAVKNKTPEEAAANLFNVTSPDERRDAIAYLETRPYGHEAPYMEAYKVLITDPSAMVRAQAYRALGTSHRADVIPTLIKGLEDKSAEVRRDVAWSFTQTWTNEATPAVANALRRDSDEQVRIYCARALRSDRAPESLRALIEALDDSNAAVNHWAHDSLVHLTGQNLPVDSHAWLTWFQQSQPAATQPEQPLPPQG